jgi:phosphoribosylformylglycinamidine cyclo-ligase
MIYEQSATTWQEMYKVFNMGHRMEVYVSPGDAERVMAIARTFAVDARVIGRVEASEQKRVTLRTSNGEFVYTG